ncbi:MAG: hypothetical protein AAFR39_00870 [Pseudomonadota bacterium]
MKSYKLFIVAVAIAALPAAGGVNTSQHTGSTMQFSEVYGLSSAFAGPAVRSARRSERRTTYYYSLPAGCVTRVVRGVRYSYCDGLYYQAVVDASGIDAYIIIYP